MNKEAGLSFGLSVSGLKGTNFLVASTEYDPSYNVNTFNGLDLVRKKNK
jgi:hypothetical protein